jgi:enterochelin esterase-like enzyme
LLHGSGQIEASWTWTGRANVIMDNQLADGKIKPMVVVMPYGHLPREIKPAPAAPSGQVDAHAIAGLSMDSAQSLSIGQHSLDQFVYIGAFSGRGNRAEWEKADPALLNKKLKVLWLAAGRKTRRLAA